VRETQLSGRQIVMVVLVVVIFMGAMMAYVFVVLPSNIDPIGSRHTAVAWGLIATFAAIWFVKLAVDSARDRRQGIVRGPAKVTGRFNILFGGAVTLGGIICSALTYWTAVSAGSGICTLYYGMIAWGIAQMLFGWWRIRAVR
jgi:hypothetical protein